MHFYPFRSFSPAGGNLDFSPFLPHNMIGKFIIIMGVDALSPARKLIRKEQGLMKNEHTPATPPHCNYYIIGESRTNSDNAITSIYGSFYMAFEVDAQTELVLKFGCTHTLDLTEEFLRDIFVGQSFPAIENWLDNTLKHYYGGSSRRAVLTSYRDALKRYRTMKESVRTDS